MESIPNVFQILDARLNLIEQLLIEIKHKRIEPESAPPARRSMNIDEVCTYTGLCKQSVYKKTSLNEIPHSRRGRRLFFDREIIDLWLLENRRVTTSEAENQAEQYLRTNAARRAK
jgi:excisionase family DNA binding protein